MRIIDLVVLGRGILELMSRNDIKVKDVNYIKLYEEYEKRRCSKEKYEVIVSELSKEYGLSRSSVSRIISKFKGNVNI